MEGGCAGVEIYPSPFFSATSPSREVGGQSRSGPLPGGCCSRWSAAMSSQVLMLI